MRPTQAAFGQHPGSCPAGKRSKSLFEDIGISDVFAGGAGAGMLPRVARRLCGGHGCASLFLAL